MEARRPARFPLFYYTPQKLERQAPKPHSGAGRHFPRGSPGRPAVPRKGRWAALFAASGGGDCFLPSGGDPAGKAACRGRRGRRQPGGHSPSVLPRACRRRLPPHAKARPAHRQVCSPPGVLAAGGKQKKRPATHCELPAAGREGEYKNDRFKRGPLV